MLPSYPFSSFQDVNHLQELVAFHHASPNSRQCIWNQAYLMVRVSHACCPPTDVYSQLLINPTIRPGWMSLPSHKVSESLHRAHERLLQRLVGYHLQFHPVSFRDREPYEVVLFQWQIVKCVLPLHHASSNNCL